MLLPAIQHNFTGNCKSFCYLQRDKSWWDTRASWWKWWSWSPRMVGTEWPHRIERGRSWVSRRRSWHKRAGGTGWRWRHRIVVQERHPWWRWGLKYTGKISHWSSCCKKPWKFELNMHCLMLRFTSPMEEVIKFELSNLSKQLGVIEGLTSTVQICN